MRLPHNLFLVFSLLLPWWAGAQEFSLEGRVQDAATREPLAGAIIAASRSDGRVLGYTAAGGNGTFKLPLPEGAETLTVTLLGYGKKIIQAPFSSPLTITMKAGRERIASAVITTRSVEVKGDTVTYNAAAVRGKNDRNLGDLLERLPGIEMSRHGGILYNGRPINKLYIEGRDILKGEYGFASENLDAKSIKSIDVYLNHQPVKVLRDIVESNSTALNITLEDYAKGSWGGSIDAAGGRSWAPGATWSGDLLGLYVGRQNASLNKVNTNNIGTLPYYAGSQVNVFRIGEERFNRYRLQNYFSPNVDGAPLEDVHSVLNRSVNAQTIDNHSFSEDSNIGVTVKYSRDVLGSTFTGLRQYLQPGETADKRYVDIVEKQTKDTFLSAAAEFVSNTDRQYVKEALYFDLQRNSGHADILGPEALTQGTEGKRLDINNILDLTFRVKKRNVIRLSNYTQYTDKDDALCVSRDHLEQALRVQVFYNSLQLSGIARTAREWTFTLTPRLTFYWRLLASTLAGQLPAVIPGQTVQDLSIWSVQPGLNAEIVRRIGQWRIGVNAAGEYRYYNFRAQTDRRESLPTLSGSAFVKYARGRVETEFSYTYSLDIQDDQTIGQALILSAYNTLWTGRQNLVRLPMHRVQFDFGFHEPLTGVYFRVHSSAQSGQSNPESRALFDDYVLIRETDGVAKMQSILNSVSLSRGLPAIRGKVDARVSHDINRFVLWQDGFDVDYNSSSLQTSLDFKANPLRWLGFEYAGDYMLTNFSLKGEREPFRHDLRQKLSVSLLPGDRWEFQISSEHRLNVVSETQGVLLLGANVLWRVTPSVRFHLQGINLLDKREYVVVTTSPLLISSSSWQIRPRTLLLGVEWKF